MYYAAASEHLPPFHSYVILKYRQIIISHEAKISFS